MWCGSMPTAAASWSARARRCACSRIRLREVNWIGDGALDHAVGQWPRDLRAGALDARAAAGVAARGRDGSVEVELVAGEEGVSPGQACVFYDAPRAGARARRRHSSRARSLQRARAQARGCRQRRRSACDRATALAARSDGSEIDRDAVDKGLCALGADLRSRVRRGVRSRPQGLDRGGRTHRRPHPRCRRRHRHFAAGLSRARTALSASIFRRRCCARRRSACATHRAEQCRGARGDGREESGASRTASSMWWWRNMSSPRCRTPRRRSTSSCACCKPGGEIILVNHHRRRERTARRMFERGVRAVGAPARLAAGISVGSGLAQWAARAWRRRAWSNAAPMPPIGHFSLIRFAKHRRFVGDRARRRGARTARRPAHPGGVMPAASRATALPGENAGLLESAANSPKSRPSRSAVTTVWRSSSAG